MPYAAVAPPAPLRLIGPVAAIAVDADRRRLFAAGARSVGIIDADTGKLLATIRIGGGPRSLAIEPLGGHVFVGTNDGHVAEVDPDRKTIVRSAAVAAGPIAVLRYNALLGRLFADGPGRQAIDVADMRSLAPAASFPFPSRVPGDLLTDEVTGELYVDDSNGEIEVLAPRDGTVRAHFPTPGLSGTAHMLFDVTFGQLVVVGNNGVLEVYDRAGTLRQRITAPAGMSGCDLDTDAHMLACTGTAGLSFFQLRREAAPVDAGTLPLAGPALAAFDAKTNDVLAVRSDPDGSNTNFERFSAAVGRDTHQIP